MIPSYPLNRVGGKRKRASLELLVPAGGILFRRSYFYLAIALDVGYACFIEGEESERLNDLPQVMQQKVVGVGFEFRSH